MAEYCYACGKKLGIFEYGYSIINGKHELCDKCYGRIRGKAVALKYAVENPETKEGGDVRGRYNEYVSAVQDSGFNPQVQQALIEDGSELLGRANSTPRISRPVETSAPTAAPVKKESAPAKYIIKPAHEGIPSSAAMFCRVIGVIDIVIGFFVAISMGGSLSSFFSSISGNHYKASSPSFGVFLITLIPFIITGGLAICLAELLENVKSIANSLEYMNVIENNNELNKVGTIQVRTPKAFENPDVSAPISGTPEVRYPVSNRSQNNNYNNNQRNGAAAGGNNNAFPGRGGNYNQGYKLCPKCHSNVPMGSKYCFRCGTVFGQSDYQR